MKCLRSNLNKPPKRNDHFLTKIPSRCRGVLGALEMQLMASHCSPRASVGVLSIFVFFTIASQDTASPMFRKTLQIHFLHVPLWRYSSPWAVWHCNGTISSSSSSVTQQHSPTGSSFCSNVRDIFRMWRCKFSVSSSQTGKTSNRIWLKKFSSVLKHVRHLFITFALERPSRGRKIWEI